MAEVVVSLQSELRGDLKAPFGEIYTDTDALLSAASPPIVAVGDVVTAHLVEAGRVPDVALVDDRTERSPVDESVAASITGFDQTVTVENPAATLTAELLATLADASEADGTTLIHVEGEEDLAALPAIMLAPTGSTIVYGQPGEGMVLVVVDQATMDRVRDILSRMNGDTERLWSLLAGDA